MADQQRWFKLWCSAPSDDHLQRLPVADRWAWAVLGTYTKEHGTRGTVSIAPSNAALAAQMGIPVTELVVTLSRLPHVHVARNDQNPEHGEVTVTWQNWVKYQEDTTQAARQRRSRAKKRGEEKREEVPPKPPMIAHATRSNGAKPIAAILPGDETWARLRTHGPAKRAD